MMVLDFIFARICAFSGHSRPYFAIIDEAVGCWEWRHLLSVSLLTRKRWWHYQHRRRDNEAVINNIFYYNQKITFSTKHGNLTTDKDR